MKHTFVVATVLLLFACSGSGGAGPDPNPDPNPDPDPDPDPDLVEVHLTSSLSFSPSELTIEPGTTVRWINDTDISHTVTPDDPNQPGVWQRQVTDEAGTVFEHTFDQADQSYDYHCEPHRSQGMTGVVQVTSGG